MTLGKAMINVHDLVGTAIQGWHLIKYLGSGADGVVYVGTKDQKEAAIKIFIPEALAKNGYDEGTQRLELQLSLKGSKRHPNLVEVYDGGTAPEVESLYLAMELVAGESLEKIIEKVPTENIALLIKQLAAAAQFLESEGLVHRDIKPANIIVSPDFTKLTLLDLGIIMNLSGDNERLSGDDFVATTRYSPPEFVWRSEVTSEDQAWRAITFYQIGATLHDLIMRKPIFSDCDRPKAKLYDAVKFKPPEISSETCPPWLIQLASTCLIKNWRDRVGLVSWASFEGPIGGEIDLEYRKKSIRLRQIRHEESKVLAQLVQPEETKNSRDKEIWVLNNQVFLDIRNYLMSESIFPKFSATNTQHSSQFEFEKDEGLMFEEILTLTLEFSIGKVVSLATELKINATLKSGDVIFDGIWTEMLTVEHATGIIQQSLLQIAEKIVPKV